MNHLRVILLVIMFLFPLMSVADIKININTADAATLSEYVIGVGPRKAEAIVQYRKKHGLFRTVDDLAKVKGIGPKTIEKNRAILSVNLDYR